MKAFRKREKVGQDVAWYYSQISHFYSNLSAPEARYHFPDKFQPYIRLDTYPGDFEILI
jgi:hypothetical protein